MEPENYTFDEDGTLEEVVIAVAVIAIMILLGLVCFSIYKSLLKGV